MKAHSSMLQVRERAARLPSADELSEDLAAESGHELFE